MFTNKISAIYLMILSSIAISFGGLIMRNITEADPWQIVFYRAIGFNFSILILLLIQNRKLVFKVTREIGFPGILAGLCLASANMLFVHAFAHTTIANALFTLSSIPFITALIAYFFLNEKITKLNLIIMLLAFIGIFIMIKGGLNSGGVLGNILAILTALSFSLFTIILRKFRNINMFPTLLVSGLFILSFSFLINFSFYDFVIPISDISLSFFWGAVLSGFVNSIFIFCTRYLQASEITFFMLLEFALGPLWVWIFLNETITLETFLGGIIVMLCVAAYSYLETMKNREFLIKN